jgi:molybdopterin synthase catalytic subunit
MVIFSGEVRILNNGKEVDYLEYEAYEPLAQKLIMQIVNDAKEKWKLNNAYCIHRLGRLEISDCAIIVITCSVHRSEAYKANQYIIDRVKSEVPIWKNEHFTDGTNQWGSNSDCKCTTHTH